MFFLATLNNFRKFSIASIFDFGYVIGYMLIINVVIDIIWFYLRFIPRELCEPFEFEMH